MGNPWRYACKRIDPETGWIYFGRRYYDPEIGRWTIPDPSSFEDGPNLYAYLHQSPIMRYDEYGLFAEETHSDQVEGTTSPIAGIDRRDRQKDNRTFFQKTKDAFLAVFKDPLTGITKRHLRQYCIDTNQTDFLQSDQRFSVETEKKTFTDDWCDHCENTGAVITYITVVKGPQMAKWGFAGLTGYFARKYFGQAVRNELEIASTRASPGESGPITLAESVETSVGRGLTETGQVASRVAKLDFDGLSQAASAADRGGFTVAGRSLTKHGSGARPANSLFPTAKGNPGEINIQAQIVVDDILTTPGAMIQTSYRGRFGNTIEVTTPGGRGIVYDVKGNFLFFKE